MAKELKQPSSFMTIDTSSFPSRPFHPVIQPVSVRQPKNTFTTIQTGKKKTLENSILFISLRQ